MATVCLFSLHVNFSRETLSGKIVHDRVALRIILETIPTVGFTKMRKFHQEFQKMPHRVNFDNQKRSFDTNAEFRKGSLKFINQLNLCNRST